MGPLGKVLLFAALASTVHCCNPVPPPPPSNDLPDGVCTLEDHACEMEDNLVDIVPAIPALAICRQLCRDNKNCTFITHYGAEGYPFSDTCVLMTACDKTHECTSCTTENSKCTPLQKKEICSSAVESQLGENMIEFIPHVETETDCRAACISEAACVFYTYHGASDPVFPATCILLSSLKEPIQACQSCKTGAADCSNSCLFLQDGNLTKSLMFTETYEQSTVQAVALGSCELMTLGVGGGGSGSTGSYSQGGGGSGAVEHKEVDVNGTVMLIINVGAERETSTVFLDGQVLLEAKPGANGNSASCSSDCLDANGGEGFCGGGGGGKESGGDGGTNSGNGHNGQGNGGSGGEGSGVVLTNITVNGFILTHGKGGLSVSTKGGGGGGVMVNGHGASGGDTHDGQGFGGGGSYGPGLPGVIVISYN